MIARILAVSTAVAANERGAGGLLWPMLAAYDGFWGGKQSEKLLLMLHDVLKLSILIALIIPATTRRGAQFKFIKKFAFGFLLYILYKLGHLKKEAL
jgi:hypothetical protein